MGRHREFFKSEMNILHLAERDEGGAGIASRNLNELLNRAGNSSLLVVKQSKSQNDNVIVFNKVISQSYFRLIILKNKNRFKRLFRTATEFFDKKYGFFNKDENKTDYLAEEILDVVPFKPDVIILHWISNFINLNTVRRLAEKSGAKILWIMMDNSPLTGGCHYTWDCVGYQTDCSECVAILDSNKKHIAKANLKFKKDSLSEGIELIACSESDYIRAQRSSIFGKSKLHKLLLPVDENSFKPHDKTIARREFSIPHNKKVLFCGSIDYGRERKGAQFLLDSLIELQSKYISEGEDLDRFVILTIKTRSKNIFKDIKIPVLQVDFLNEEKLIMAYQAADIFLSPSVEDSGPLMVNQAIMTGTPVVAFNIGVALDLVITGETGYLADLKDVMDYAKGIKTLLDLNDSKYDLISQNCRSLGVEMFGHKSFSKQFSKIVHDN